MLIEEVLSLYLKRGYSGVAVYIPPDSLAQLQPMTFKDDRLMVRIAEAKVTDVLVQHRVQEKWKPWKREGSGQADGPRRSIRKPERWLKESANLPRSYVRRRDLEDLVDAVERHPGRSAAAVIKAAETPASQGPESEVGREVAVELRVVDADPLTLYTQLSNTGSQTTEELRFRVGVLHNNLFGRDDILTLDFQGAADEDVGDNFATFVSYDCPLWDRRWRLRTFGAYSKFKSTDILGPGSSFLGDGYVAGEEISYTLWQQNGWFLDLFQTIDFQNSKVDNPFGLGSELNLFDVGGGARIERSKGTWQTSIEFKGSTNLTDALDLSEEEDFLRSRFNTGPGYYLLNLRGYQNWSANAWFSLNQQIGGLYSSDRLVAARQLSIGGLNTIRGYEEFEALGDRGAYLSTDPRVRVNALVPGFERFLVQVEWIPAFLDVGWVDVEKPLQGENDSSTLISTGTGLRLYLRDFFFARLYWGYALHDADDDGEGTQSGDSRLHFEVTLRF